MSVVQQEEFIQAVNSEIETAQQKRDKCDQQLAKYNVNDRELNEKNTELNAEIQQLQQVQSDEQKKLDTQKKEYRRIQQDALDNERNVKKFEAKMEKVRRTIDTLEENIQAELNSLVN